MPPPSSKNAKAVAKDAAKKKAQDPASVRAMERAKKQRQRQQQKKNFYLHDLLAKSLKHEASESKRVAELNRLAIAANGKAIKAQATQSNLDQKTREAVTIAAAVQHSVDNLRKEDEQDIKDVIDDDIPADRPTTTAVNLLDDGRSLPSKVEVFGATPQPRWACLDGACLRQGVRRQGVSRWGVSRAVADPVAHPWSLPTPKTADTAHQPTPKRPANGQGAYHLLMPLDRPIVTTEYRLIEVDTRNSNDLTTWAGGGRMNSVTNMSPVPKASVG